MTSARDIMTKNPDYLDGDATITDVAKRLATESVGAVPICDSTGDLRSVVTDQNVVIDVVAAGKNPDKVKAIDLVQGEAVTIGADDSVDEAIQTMMAHKVRRLPVIDGRKLVGMVSQADIARACAPDKVGDLVAAISQ
jgi:CBS domain-containing protein